ncbi:MAG TPA: hypothetical protein VN408_15575, partial [Actinoplanes sp.]|nr:hypothetical protein [Actinoplanes sp.]
PSPALAAVPWTVSAVSEPYDTFDGTLVEVEITSGGVSGRGVFELRETGGRWRIGNPFGALTVPEAPIRLPQWAIGERKVWPGVYRAAALAPEAVRLTRTSDVAVMPSISPFRRAVTRAFDPTTVTRQRFQQVSDAYLDECLTDASCGALAAGDYYRVPGDLIPEFRVRTKTWKVIRYPAVDLTGVTVPAAGQRLAFGGQVTVPGILRLDAETEDGERFASDCLLDTTYYHLAAWADETGALQPEWNAADKGIKVHCRDWS